MALEVNMGGSGTGAGLRKPYAGGHGPKCVCTRCEFYRSRGIEAANNLLSADDPRRQS